MYKTVEYIIKPAKLKKLINGLKSKKYDEDLNNYEPFIILIDRKHYDELKAGLIPNANNYMANYGLSLNDIPEYTNICHCTCSTLKRNNIIRHKKENYLLIIGSCCYKAMSNKENRERLCFICGEPTKNRKDRNCNKCRLLKLKDKENKKKIFSDLKIRESKINFKKKLFKIKLNEIIKKKLYIYNWFLYMNNKKMNFGKHKNIIYSKIKDDKKYINWINGLDNPVLFYDFLEYLEKLEYYKKKYNIIL